MPSKQQALTALYGANAKPKTIIETSTPSDRVTIQSTGTSPDLSRTRDRFERARRTPDPQTEMETTEERNERWYRSVELERQRLEQQAVESAERRRNEALQRAKERETQRLRAENDKLALEQHRNLVCERALQDGTKREVLEILRAYDMLGNVERVAALVNEWHMEKVPLAWETACQQLREDYEKKS